MKCVENYSQENVMLLLHSNLSSEQNGALLLQKFKAIEKFDQVATTVVV